MKKKYNQQYIADVSNRIQEILGDKREFSDWTQFSITIQDAIQAAATVYGVFTDEDKDKLNSFLSEVVLSSIHNIQNFDITFQKKSNGQ